MDMETTISMETCLKLNRTPTFQKIVLFPSMKSPLKIIKNVFYFILKLFSFSRYLNVYLDFLVMSKNGSMKR